MPPTQSERKAGNGALLLSVGTTPRARLFSNKSGLPLDNGVSNAIMYRSIVFFLESHYDKA